MASIIRAAALALGVSFAIGCASLASAQTAPGVTKDSITIGSWVALSGPIAIYGVPTRAGAQAYFSLVNDKGGVNGRKINWIVDDNAYNPQQTVTIARKLVSSDKVLAVVVPHGTAQTAAAFPYAMDQEKVPLLVPNGGAADWYTPPKPGLLGVHVLYEDQAQDLGRWAVQDGAKNVLVVFGAAAAFENVANNAVTGVKAANPGVKVETMSVKIGTTDYAPIALEINGKKPDAIISIQIQQEVVALARSLKQQGGKATIYTYAPNTTQSIIDLGGADIDGLKALSLTTSPFDDTPAAKEYRDALAKYFPSEKPDFTSYWTFGLAKIFVEALSKAPEPLTRDSLLKGFYALKDYDSGIYPPVSFSAERPLGATSLRRMTIANGKWQTVGNWISVAK